jgi:hypothetical protein
MCESIITTYIIQTVSVDDAMEHYKEINEQLTWEIIEWLWTTKKN